MLNEKLIYEAQRMLHERYAYFHKQEQQSESDSKKTYYYMVSSMADAYKAACDILSAVMEENEEILKSFDYYGEKS